MIMKVKTPEVPKTLRRNRAQVERLYSEYPYVVLDFETTLLSVPEDRALEDAEFAWAGNPFADVVCACWYVVQGENAVEKKSKFGGVTKQQELLKDIKAAKFIVAHGAKFELQWLHQCGLDIRDVVVWDTLTAEWVLRANARYSLSLGSLADRYGLPAKEDIVGGLIRLGVKTADIPGAWVEKYCFRDVHIAHRLMRLQRKRLMDEDMLHLAYTRFMACPPIADMELGFLHLDKERVAEESLNTSNAIKELIATLDTLTGGINLNSPKQLREFLFQSLGFDPPKDPGRGKPLLTPGGEASTSQDALLRLRPKTQAQKDFLQAYMEFNKLNSRVTKNLEFFDLICKHFDGKFRPRLNQGITNTGRLSATGRKMRIPGMKKEKGAQVQNIPREYKKFFCAGKKGWSILECDASQLEFRCAADLCKDVVALKEIKEGVDVHAISAEYLTAGGQPTTRQEAKRCTFMPLYGGNGKTPAERKYCEFFRRKYANIAKEQSRWELFVANEKYLRTRYGMLFHWPKATMDSRGYLDVRREVYNYPIQGFATGEIIPIAFTILWHAMDHSKAKMLLTVHDSIILEADDKYLEELESLCRFAFIEGTKMFLKNVYDYEFKVPLAVDVKKGSHWGEQYKEDCMECDEYDFDDDDYPEH